MEYSKVKKEYSIRGYTTLSCGNLYAYFVERSITLIRRIGRFGMIVQNSIVSTDRMLPIQKILFKYFDAFISNFDDRPAKLFTGLNHMKGSIILGTPHQTSHIHSTKFLCWYDRERENIFGLLCYIDAVSYTHLTLPTTPYV